MVLVPVAGIFMKRKLGLNIWAGVGLGVIGLYLLSVPAGGFSIGKGELIAIGGAFAFAAHILVIDYFCKSVNNIALSCAQFFFAGILSVVCMFIFEEPNIEDILSASVPLLYAGVMSCGVAFTAQIFGQKYSDPTVASILLCLESVFAVIFGFIFLKDKLQSREMIGCVIMFTAIMLTQIPAEKFKLKRK
jgi:drug/metabolite transporter (DMT)-like permease